MKTLHLFIKKYTYLLHDGTTSGYSRIKNWGHCGAKEESGVQHKCLSCMVIFRCNEH